MTEIKFLKKMEKSPRLNTKIFRLLPPRVKEKKLLQTAKVFDLKGEKKAGELMIVPDEMTYTEGPYVVNLCRYSGALRYYDSSRWQVDDGKSTVTISDDRATNIAKNYIKDKKIVPLNECKLLKVTRLYVGSMKKGSNTAEERVIDIGVVFQRVIEGVPVEGPGGKVMVYIDHEGKVTGCDRIWRDIKEMYRPVPFRELRIPKFAEDNLVRYWRRSIYDLIEVEKARFGYFELSRGKSQRYLQPVYILPTRHLSAEKRIIMKSVHVVPAAIRSVGRIMPPPKGAPPPAKRRA